MSLHGSPIIHSSTVARSPYREWLSQARTETEYVRLAHALSAFPVAWLLWADGIVKRRQIEGIHIRNVPQYRLAVLWSGIVLLQESKFLCDMFENALRAGICRHCTVESIALDNLEISGWKNIADRYLTRHKSLPDATKPISDLVLNEMTLGGTKELIYNNWARVLRAPGKRGFAHLFWRAPECRDAKLFRHEVGAIVQDRNDIAHSNKLFRNSDVAQLYKRVDRWLSALDVGLEPRILRYRRERRDFLKDLECSVVRGGEIF